MPSSSTVSRDGESRYSQGQVLAEKYVLLRHLGEGGMGEVWVAHNRALDAHVAIKLISAEAASADEHATLAERLLREARATAKIDHPAIVKVFDFGRTRRGDPMIVMELLDGVDLGTVLGERGRLSPSRTLRTLLPVAHGLAAAHDKGIIHRDLKPENIFLAQAEDGRTQPKILDFGIAMQAQQASHRLTRDGSLLGSPDYMSPEQAYGDEVTALADLWTFSVVLYEALAGHLPFRGKNYNALLRAITHDEPAPIEGFDGAGELWSIVEKGLRKNPKERWESMREMGLRLALWLNARGVNEDLSGVSLDAAWLEPAGLAVAMPSVLPPPPDSTPSSRGRPTPISSPGGAPTDPAAPDLATLAAIHRDGDPVRLMERQSRRRTLLAAVALALLVVAATSAILVGTGMID